MIYKKLKILYYVLDLFLIKFKWQRKKNNHYYGINTTFLSLSVFPRKIHKVKHRFDSSKYICLFNITFW